jgi:starch synthase
MRISFISYDFGEYCVRHANALSELADTEVQLVLPKGQAGKYEQQIDGKVHPLLFARPRFRQPLRQLACIRRMLHEIEAFQPQVVHFQGAHLWFNFALRKLRKYPLVLTAHNVTHHLGDHASQRTPQWVMDYGYRQADRLIVHGAALQSELQSRLGIEQSRVHVIPHITMGSAASMNSPEDPHMILFFGRIWEYKGLEYLIRAEPLISQRVPNVRIVIAGTGEDFGKYRKLMINPQRFEIHNERVSDEKREQLFAEAAIVTLPYVDGTQSGVIPIAFNHGKPVVATRVGALGEAVLDGETGLLVPPKDERALADALVRLLQDPSLRHRLGRAGKTRLDQQGSPRIIAELHLAAYQSAIESRLPHKAGATA